MIGPHLRQVLRERREAADLRQDDVAGHSGVAISEISRLENGGRERNALDRVDQLVEAYAKALGIPADQLWAEAIERSRIGDALPEPMRQIPRKLRRARRRRPLGPV